MSTELPANDFPFLNRLLAEIKLLKESKRPRRSNAQKSESLPAKRECGGRANGLPRPARQSKAATAMAGDLLRDSR